MTDAMMVPLSLTGGFMPAAVMITKCGISAWKYYRSGGEVGERERARARERERERERERGRERERERDR